MIGLMIIYILTAWTAGNSHAKFKRACVMVLEDKSNKIFPIYRECLRSAKRDQELLDSRTRRPNPRDSRFHRRI